MKYLLVLLVVVGGLWLLLRKRGGDPGPTPRRRPEKERPAEMVACAHCDLRLPRGEAVFDDQGRPYCDAPHRHAGPH